MRSPAKKEARGHATRGPLDVELGDEVVDAACYGNFIGAMLRCAANSWLRGDVIFLSIVNILMRQPCALVRRASTRHHAPGRSALLKLSPTSASPKATLALQPFPVATRHACLAAGETNSGRATHSHGHGNIIDSIFYINVCTSYMYYHAVNNIVLKIGEFLDSMVEEKL
jgi:hypothetical protein